MKHTEIAKIRRDIRRWRKNKSYRTEPMPEELRDRVLGLSKKYPPGTLSSELGVSCWHLQRMQRKTKQKVPRRKKKPKPRGKFVEVRPATIGVGPVATAGKWTAEIEWRRADGSTVTTRVTDPSALDWKALAEALPRAGR